MEEIIKSEDQVYKALLGLRKKNQLTQKELALFSGVSIRTIAKIETGETDIQLSTLLKLLNRLKGRIKIFSE